MWGHLVKSASWSQKYVAGLTLAGLNQLDQNELARRASISTDPSSILVFTQDPDAQGQPMVGFFGIATDPNDLLESISKYEMRVALSLDCPLQTFQEGSRPKKWIRPGSVQVRTKGSTKEVCPHFQNV
jgi:hypothetical protein